MQSIKKNQRLSQIEKQEVQKYNAELYSLLGVKFKCNTLKDYYLIKALYLLIQIPIDLIKSGYYEKLLSTYYNDLKLKIDSKTLKPKLVDRTLEGYFFNYGYTEGLYQYYLKYYYNVCLNFTSFLAIYSGDMLPFMTFEHTTNAALNKLFKFVEEQSIDMVRYEMSELSDLSKEYNIDIEFIWRAKHDEKTCSICKDLDNEIFTWAPQLAHPNCRCTLEMIIREY